MINIITYADSFIYFFLYKRLLNWWNIRSITNGPASINFFSIIVLRMKRIKIKVRCKKI